MSNITFVNEQAENPITDRLQNYWQNYHLKQPPFEDYSQFAMYYPVGHWQSHLKYLQGFCRGSQPLLLIEGEFGIGKSMLLAQFLTQLSDDTIAYQIKGRSVITAAQLIAEVAQGFQLPMVLSQPTLLQQMDAELATLQRMQKTCLLVIDDADLLPTETLAALIHLTTAQNKNDIHLYLLLSCELDLQNHLETIAKEQGYLLYFPALTLVPLDLDETKNYIKHRMTKAGLSGKFPFDKEMIACIYELSGGVPGRINRVAQQMLIDLLKPSEERLPLLRKKEGNHLFLKSGYLQIMTFSLLFLIVLGVFLFHQQKPWRPETRIAVNLPLQFAAEKKPTVDAAITVPKVNNSQLRHVEAEVIAGNNPAPAMSETVVPHSDLAANNIALNQAIRSAMQENNASPNHTAAEKNSESNVIEKNVENVAANSVAPSTSTTALSSNAVASPAHDQENIKTEENSVPSKSSALISVPPHSLNKEQQKILALSGYTLQLLGSRNPADLKRFISANKISSQHVMQFKTEFQGKPWYVLIYGNYSSVSEARLAMKKLTKSMRSSHVWVRPMASVHKAIKNRI